jgi:hypothetical protein
MVSPMAGTAGSPDLGELLVLLLNAHRSFDTLCGELRTWRHDARSHEAFRRQQEGRRGSVSMSTVSFGGASGEAEPAPVESEELGRLWLARPDRLREEWSGSAGGTVGATTFVEVGPTWWSLDAHGAYSNNGSPEMQHGSRLPPMMLDPAGLLASRDFEITGDAVHAGRAAIRVVTHASPRDRILPETHQPFETWPQELLVDRERGVLLRSVSLLEGEPFALTEFLSIAFDEQIPGERFVFEPPPGVSVGDVRDRFSPLRLLPLHEAAGEAPFGVFVVDSVPADWTMRVHLMAESDNYGWPASVLIHYANEMSSVNVNINQHAVANEAMPAKAPDGSDWRVERLESGEVRLWEPSEPERGMPRIAITEIAGTRIQISTGDLALEDIAGLTARLVPAPTEPPALA